jgi:dimethylaniline monooxygenase (N-oxide forming)
VISDRFPEYVAGGAIRARKTATLAFDEHGARFADGSRADVDDVIFCTGFRARLPYLGPDLPARLDFRPDDPLQPLLLHKCVFHPDLPGLACVGLYRGAFFATMELQARWAARVLSGAQPAPSRDAMLAGIAAERRIRELRPRPQFPHGDYVTYADDLAGEIGVLPELSDRHPLRPQILRGPVVPAHYRLTGPHAAPALAERIIRSTPNPLMSGNRS